MRVQVIGPGCARCKELARRTEAAVRQFDAAIAVEKVTDLKDMMQFRIMTTPALAIDGVVKVAGRVPTESEIRVLLEAGRHPEGRT